MSVDPDAVNKMLDEIALGDQQKQAGQVEKPAAQDANTLLDQAIKPQAVQPQPQPQSPQPAIDPEKYGRVINENAQIRGELDRLRAQVESLNQPKPEPQTPRADDGGWGNWATRMVAETDDATWMANPKEGVEKTLERAGRELTTHVSQIATARAWEVGAAMQLDSDFSSRYPELMSTEMGQIAVRNAIGKVVGDRRFQALMQNRKERHKALDVVAKLANQDLGRNTDADPAFDEAMNIPSRKTVYAERQGARPMGPVNAQPPERQTEAMDAVINEMKGRLS